MIVYGGYRGRPLSDMWVLDTGKNKKQKQDGRVTVKCRIFGIA
jgi:hypothetical protein